MTPQIWATAKSLFLEASDAPSGPDLFLEHLPGIDPGVVALVRRMLSEEGTGPDLLHPCWVTQENELRRAFEPGRLLLDRFEIVDFLGAGGLGEVYRAFDHRQLVFLAVKTLRTKSSTDATAVRQLRNELNTARCVTHPNVCRLHDLHWSQDPDEPPFFTMDLLNGVTLSQHLRTLGPLDTVTAWPLVDQIIDGLATAHENNIIHRDLKTSNIMVTDNGHRVVIMDFGLARQVTPGTSIETTLGGSSFAGTPAFMAPEQLRGGKASIASDIYSLGVVLFEIATGRLPFEGNGPLEIASQRLHQEAPSPRIFTPRLDRRWDYTILKCVADNPADRPGTVRAVGKMLKSAPPMLWGRRRFLLGAVACAGVSVAGSFGILIQRARHRSPAEVDIFDFENRTGRRELDYVARGTTTELLRRFRSIEHVSAVAMHSARPRSLPAVDGSLALSGTVKGEGAGPFVVDLRLEEAPSGKTVWAAKFDEKQFKGLLELQDEISKQAVAQLRRYLSSQNPLVAALQFSDPPAGKAFEAPTHSTAAFDLYLRGSSLLQESTPESLTAAIGFFERAIGEDPHFALAMAGIAEANLVFLNFGHDVNLQYSAKAREYAMKAIAEDPSLAEAHAAMAAVHQIDWNWAASEAEYDRALQLKPKFPRAIRWRAGLVLQFERFDEAIASFEEAYRQDPYDRSAISGYSMALIFAGRLREAIDLLTREIGNRDMAGARANLVVSLGLLAKRSSGAVADELFRRAFQEVDTIAAIERRSPSGLSLFSNNLKSWLYSVQGNGMSAARYMEEFEREVAAGQTSPALLAQTYVAQGHYDEALDTLTQAVLQRDSSVATMRANILYSELRGQPRFESLLRTAHLK